MSETRPAGSTSTGRFKPAPSSRRVRRAVEPTSFAASKAEAPSGRGATVRIQRVESAMKRISDPAFDLEQQFKAAMEVLIAREL